MEENNIRKAPLPEETLEQVNAGYGSGSGFYMTVGNCNGSYLALRPQPVWDQYHELAQLYPGYQVFTYGQTTNGTGLHGVPCTYRYVCYNGVWGFANACFLY
jgi:hypothetical protein